MVQISNTNIVKNADGLISKKPSDIDVEWIGRTKKRVPENKFKVTC